jgi:CRP-like cAMP-binding protein
MIRSYATNMVNVIGTTPSATIAALAALARGGTSLPRSLPRRVQWPISTHRLSTSGAMAPHMGPMAPTLQTHEIRTSLKSGVSLFENLPEDGIDRAITLARRDKRARGEVLFEQGGSAEAFYLILGGRLKVSQTTPDGQQVIMRYLGPRDIAGCVAVCGGVPYPATATAVEDTWLLSWTRPRIAELAERHPEIALRAMRIMGGRMVELQERLKEMQTERAERRIAHALGRLVVQAGRRTAGGIEIDFPITRQDLAEMTGKTLHTVSRTLSEWETAGLISSGRQRVVILRPHALVSIAEDLPDRGN